MKKQLVGMNLVASLLVLAMAVMAVVGLSIPTATEHYFSYYYGYETTTFNGFNTLFGDDYLSDYSAAIAAVNWVLLLAGLTCVTLAFLAMFYFSDNVVRKAEMAIVIISIVTAFLYMVEGIAMVVLWRGGDYATTAAPALFSIQAGLLIAYFVCNHFNKVDSTSAESEAVAIHSQPQYTRQTPKANTANVAEELTKYKQLLDMGAITQEEFDAKKKELLNL